MATVSTTGLYPEDLHGVNPLNLIDNEIQTLSVPGKDDYYFIIPHAAPFFVDSLEVYNAQTGQKYVENEDYLVGHWFIEAMNSIGRPIAGSIRFMKRTIVGQVRLKYRTIGGNWGFSETQILAELNRKLLNPLTRSWGMIGELPYSFPPLEHDQSIDSLVGSVQIVAALSHLADVIEASAAGATDQHLRDFNNPHRVTKAQVLLGLVQNFGMATAQEAIQGVRADAYVSPATMKAAIDAQAIVPLNAHIRATGNVHGMVAADINLGNVPNYPAATPTQAVDVTNSTTLMTPYTTALLIQRLQNTQRIDELENKINQHIADTTGNPHQITPEMIGTYTKERIDQLIAAAGGGGGDASTFGGKTPSEWASEFVSTAEFNKFISDEQFGGSVTTARTAISDPTNAPPPLTPEEEQAYNISKITGANAGYEAYVVSTGNWAGRLIASSNVPMDPTAGQPAYDAYMPDSQNHWISLKDRRYSVSSRGGIRCSGPAAFQVPAAYNESSATVAKPVLGIWATHTEVYAHMANTRELRRFRTGGVDEQIVAYTPWSVGVAGREATGVFAATQMTYPASLAIIEVEVTTGPSADQLETAVEWVILGDATFQSTLRTVINTVLATDEIQTIAFIENHIMFVTATKGCFLAALNRTNPAAVSVALVPGATLTDGDGNVAPIRAANLINNTDAGEGILTASGSYNHVAMVTNKGNVWFFGDNSQGQCEVKVNRQPVIWVAAGYNFTVTVNSLHQPQFFGDSPDNSLLYAQRGIIVKP